MSDPRPDPDASSVPQSHRAAAARCVRCAALTISDTRTEADDRSGRFIRESLEGAGHGVEVQRIVKDEPDLIRDFMNEMAARGDVQAVIMTGGTGLADRDTTYDVLADMLEKKLDGFGELFRMLSYDEIGAAAMLSRAVAGSYRGTIVFSLPGSSGAVRLAMEKLILPELAHAVGQLKG